MNKKTLLIILGIVLLLALFFIIYFFVIKPSVSGNFPTSTAALFEQVRNAVNQHLSS